jgi:outer membrane protein TolC
VIEAHAAAEVVLPAHLPTPSSETTSAKSAGDLLPRGLQRKDAGTLSRTEATLAQAKMHDDPAAPKAPSLPLDAFAPWVGSGHAAEPPAQTGPPGNSATPVSHPPHRPANAPQSHPNVQRVDHTQRQAQSPEILNLPYEGGVRSVENAVHVPQALPSNASDAPGDVASTEDALHSPPRDYFDATRQIPIHLSYALQVTAGQNPQVAFAQHRIQQAYAQLEAAEVLWMPSLRAGVNYNKHDGVIQDVGGTMVTNSRSSVYTGLGAQAVGAGSPAVPGVLMSFHVADAVFQPRIAEYTVGARRFASQATMNDQLLETALRYTDLLEAFQILSVTLETLDHADQLVELTRSFADTGQGLQADVDRATTELSVRRVEVSRAGENVRVASVRLAQVLSQQDQSQMLVPQETVLVPIDLVTPDLHVAELVATGLSTRPELAESRQLVGEAVQRLRRECYAPLVPSVLLGMSYGGNGGSPTSDITGFGDRVDFDAAAFWEVRNLGFGERAARNTERSRLEQARWEQVRVMDQIAGEVAEAHARVEARRSQMDLAFAGIEAARNSYRRNTDRIRDGQGLPIESLQAIQALDQANRQYIRAVADYNRAQFELHRALGWPIP